ncbi:unnamed protein product [Schistosoma curassoni]|uniref:DUF6451 domain-containing protein n=1 Tax=Schistosoma curassoni TaxID=6186 RepID=A0A183L524_9TREM|nr:unnamed protein product [Schistosoma curassoni]
MKQMYDRTKKLSGNRPKPERPVKSKEGKVITNIDEQRNRLVEHFKELLNRPAPLNTPNIEAATTDLPIDVGPPTIEEISMAIKQIKSGKAAGPDNIPAQALKADVAENTTSVAAASAAIGLNMHKGKSKILRYNTECTNPVTIDGEDLEDVKTFTYLGSIVDEHAGSDADVKARIGEVRSAYLQLRNIWNSKQLSTNTKIRRENEQELDGFEKRFKDRVG